MFCRNSNGIAALARQLDEVRAFLRGFGEQDAVVGQDRYRVAVQVGKAAHQGGAEQRLELIEHRAVHQSRNHFAHVERLLGIGRDHAVQLVAAVQRRRLACVAATSPCLRQLRLATLRRARARACSSLSA